MFEETYDAERALIEELIIRNGGTNINYYTLISNNGITFDLDGYRIDARHWRNSYGCEVNFFTVYPNEPDEKILQKCELIKDELNQYLKDGKLNWL